MQILASDKPNHIAKCLELAILFEVSTDKPGNVNLIVGFEGTRYEHFLASAVATVPHFEKAARKGVAISQGEITFFDAELGRIIRDCTADVNEWQRGGNTLLGTIILLSPMATAAGVTQTAEECVFEPSDIRRNLKPILEATTSEDAVNVYEAIRTANPSGLGRAPNLDISDPNSVNRIIQENVSLHQIFKIASKYDTVCSEWINNYPVTFDIAYPYLVRQIDRGKDLNVAVTNTFLKVLAECPDTFIARKVGIEKAREVSARAKQVLELGALETTPGKQSLREFDLELRKSGNLLNPGTTADLVAAALALIILGGYRP